MGNNEIINEWLGKIKSLSCEHYNSSRHYENRHKLIGTPVVILSAITSSVLFTTLKNPQVIIQIFTTILSLSVTILSGLQTFFSFFELSVKHKQTAIKYNALLRELQSASNRKWENVSTQNQFMSSFRAQWDEIESEAPTLRRTIRKRIEDI